MKKINYTKEDIKLLEQLGKGDRSTVYKDSSINKALKVYKRNAICHLDNALMYSNNKKLIENHVIVPEGIIVINNKNCGFYTEIVNGYNIYQLIKGSSFTIKTEDFINAYHKAEEDVIAISKLGYEMCDLYEENIMYDTLKKCIYFIDIDAWCKKRAKARIQNRNLYDFHESINIPKIKKHLM